MKNSRISILTLGAATLLGACDNRAIVPAANAPARPNSPASALATPPSTHAAPLGAVEPSLSPYEAGASSEAAKAKQADAGSEQAEAPTGPVIPLHSRLAVKAERPWTLSDAALPLSALEAENANRFTLEGGALTLKAIGDAQLVFKEFLGAFDAQPAAKPKRFCVAEITGSAALANERNDEAARVLPPLAVPAAEYRLGASARATAEGNDKIVTRVTYEFGPLTDSPDAEHPSMQDGIPLEITDPNYSDAASPLRLKRLYCEGDDLRLPHLERALGQQLWLVRKP